jgi:hypothetical protein
MTTETTPNPNMPRPTPEEAQAFAAKLYDTVDRKRFLKAYEDQSDMMEWIERFSEWKSNQ